MALGERNRNPLAPRSTAEGACAMRAAGALEQDPAVRCPDDMAAGFLGGFNVTTLAKHRATRNLFVRGTERRLPGAYTYEIARAKFIDEIVLAQAAGGLDELVLLGAGLDSRPYRLAEQLRRPGVRGRPSRQPRLEARPAASPTRARARSCRLRRGRLQPRRPCRRPRRGRAQTRRADAVRLVRRQHVSTEGCSGRGSLVDRRPLCPTRVGRLRRGMGGGDRRVR